MIALRSLQVAALAWQACNGSIRAEDATILKAPVHLRSGASPEWDTFAQHPPDAARLDLKFSAHTNTTEATLFIRQDDVKLDWFVDLNGRRLGKLFLMEAELVQVLAIPPGGFRDGENLLSIIPSAANDDIVVKEIRADPRPFTEAIHEASLEFVVRDAATSRPLPCRLTVVDSRGGLAPLIGLTNANPATNSADQSLAVRPGVVYTATGAARVGLPSGDYTLYASRGFEWSVATQNVHLANSAGRKVELTLRREVDTSGLVSCDTHVHTFTYSRHGDATIDERMLTLAGEGIELPIATDHNLHIDYREPAQHQGVTGYLTPVTGNEVTTTAGHFNVFPVDPEARVPDFRITDWPRLMTALRQTRGVRVVVLNHPHNVHNDFQPFAPTNFNAVSGDNLRGPEFTFDAMELLNSSAQQSDYLLVYRDWFALLNHGYRITGVGSSDVHDVSRYIVGQGRTYIVCPDQDPGRIDVDAACSNLLAGHALVSMGLLVQLTVDERFRAGDLALDLGRECRVHAVVQGPSWIEATNLSLFANGVRIREVEIARTVRPDPAAATNGVKASETWTLPRPAHDVQLVAIATGPGVTSPFWAIPKPYQPVSPHWEGRVIGSSNPVWLDADGDGQFTSPRGYARRLMTRHPGDPAGVLSELDGYDSSVAEQVASLCAATGTAIDSPEWVRALESGSPVVRQAFARFAAAEMAKVSLPR